jgi:DHA2 family metal-tetracycline-proton antiporter-like MFS transporter/DHA2 family florfenicol/chloramphenicol resistance protein-like MFS transporter
MSAASGKIRREGPAAGRLFLPVLVSAVFVTVMTAMMVNVVLPAISKDFGVSEAGVGWVVTGFMLVMAVGIPLYGRVSDFFSLRRLFSLALLLYAAGSLICALSPNLPVLVFGRIVQAAGNAAIPSLATVAVARMLPPGKRGSALGLIAFGIGVGTAVRPILGGVVEQLAGWHALFYGTLFLSLLLIPGALYALPGGAPGGERRFDLTGGILLGLGAGLFLFGVTQGQVAGFASLSSWGCFLGATLAATGFVWRITNAPHPFISPGLFENRAYVAAVILGSFSYLANISMFIFIPLLIVEVNGLVPVEAGLVLTPAAIAFAAFSPLTGRLSDRIGVSLPILSGMAVMGLSIFFISTLGTGASVVVVSVGMLGVSIGFALANPPATNAAANALPEEEVGAGLGVFQGLFFLGGAAGPALIGAFLVARKEAGSGAINPFYTLDAAPFSDAFLIVVLVLILAVAAALGLRSGTKGDKESEQVHKGEAKSKTPPT